MNSHSTMPAPTPRRAAVLSRREVESLIAHGHAVFIVDGKVFKADAWLPFHPGGDKAIMHMVGRDATDEVSALHSPEARQKMLSYQIGTVEGRWKNFVPPIQGGRFRTLEEQHAEAERHSRPLLEVDTDSSTSSEAPSPLLDPDTTSHGLRHRNAGHARSDSSSSATSFSSLDITDTAVDTPKHKATLSSQTQQEVDFDLSKYPPLDAATQDNIVQKYRALNERIKAAGLYQCDYRAYMVELSRYTLLFSLCVLFLWLGWYATAGIFLGLFWHQLVFTAHDAGHMGITHNFHVDTVIGIVVADFLGGLSLGWWKRSHNVHHIVTNSPEHDPDIEQMPFFAVSHRFFESLTSTYYDRVMQYDAAARFLVQWQHWLYYPILLFGRFNLYRLSWEYVLLGLGPRKGAAAWHRWLELAGQIFFWAWFGYGMCYRGIPTAWGRFVFVMVSHMVTGPLHVQITLSHYAMSTADLGADESFPQKMLRTTMDVDCPEWLDFVHGGLQFQAVHHLYPRMPRHNLRKAQKLVQEFCDDVGIPYALYGFVDGNKEVISRLGDVGRQAAIFAQCQRKAAESVVLGHH